ncbi:MAG TPA: carbohydrate-binding protein [Verrucomicrobiae bacterium]|nr:carbohydrate-binding protein [Verrucomicrobiae bacterium]
MKRTLLHVAGIIAIVATSRAAELHVAVGGDDASAGTVKAPLRTIQRAAEHAQPGDVITVHAGVYRERVNPPRGGESESRRIVYQAAPGEKVEIKGSEVVKNWTRVKGDVWSVAIPNAFFGNFNPYNDLIRGDWFNPKGREHHTGAVYLNGEWLIEAATLEEVLDPGKRGAAAGGGGGGMLLNVAWLRPGAGGGEAGRIPAVRYAAQQGVKNAPCAEGGECIGWLEDGDWARYEGVDFGSGAERLEIRAASQARGGQVQVWLNAPDGELLGACSVPNTGGWQSWSTFAAAVKPLSGVRTLCLVFRAVPGIAVPDAPLWFGRVDGSNTTIWAQFKGIDPNEQLVEINVRRTVFYPDKPGRNYITVRGFTMRDAATPWAPPTAEQPGLIGTHWSKGWIIEDNVVSHSTCCGIALGKHGDEFDNTSANSAEGYVKTIERAHAHPIAWTKANIGGHVVRNNTVSHCEQAGIVGSLGCSFSTVTGNTIHDIHVRRLFSGAEMAGIKFHAAIDTEISRNHIYRTTRGLWLDWMAQGTRVTRNLFHDNITEDLFVEVDHGPFLVDNNIFLSPNTLLDMSEGGAYAHNLITGKIVSSEESRRQTPYHPAHSTVVAGMADIKGGDNRYYNNIFVGAGAAPAESSKKDDRHRRVAGYGLWVYDTREFPLQTGGNVYYNGARPYAKEAGPVVATGFDPKVALVDQSLRMVLDGAAQAAKTAVVTTERLGKAKIPGLPYENPDGSPIKIDTDYLGKERDAAHPAPGPFENPGRESLFKVIGSKTGT